MSILPKPSSTRQSPYKNHYKFILTRLRLNFGHIAEDTWKYAQLKIDKKMRSFTWLNGSWKILPEHSIKVVSISFTTT